ARRRDAARWADRGRVAPPRRGVTSGGVTRSGGSAAMAGSVRVAIIGSGPSGLYAADELSKHDAVSVDVLDRLPCPYGLLRYGVAPDHLKMKSLETTLRKILERPSVRFLGGVGLGDGVTGITAAELRDYYDAVVYATGSPVDRRLGIP